MRNVSMAVPTAGALSAPSALLRAGSSPATFACACLNVRVTASGGRARRLWNRVGSALTDAVGSQLYPVVVEISPAGLELSQQRLVCSRNVQVKLPPNVGSLMHRRRSAPNVGLELSASYDMNSMSRPNSGRRSSIALSVSPDDVGSSYLVPSEWTVYYCCGCDMDCVAIEQGAGAQASNCAVIVSKMKHGTDLSRLRSLDDYSPLGLILRDSLYVSAYSNTGYNSGGDLDVMPQARRTIETERIAMEARIAEFTQQQASAFQWFEERVWRDSQRLAYIVASKPLPTGKGVVVSSSDKLANGVPSKSRRGSLSMIREAEHIMGAALETSVSGGTAIGGHDPDGDLLENVDAFGIDFDEREQDSSHDASSTTEEDEESVGVASDDLCAERCLEAGAESSALSFSNLLATSVPVPIPMQFRAEGDLDDNVADITSALGPIIPPHTMTEVSYWSTRIPKSVRQRDEPRLASSFV